MRNAIKSDNHNLKIEKNKTMKTKLLFALLFSSLLSYAIPAYRGAFTITQPDGTEIIIFKHGDEFGHYITDVNGNLLVKDENGFYRQKTTDTTENNSLILQRQQARATNAQKRMQYNTRTNTANRGVVILVNFADKSFVTSNPQQTFSNLLNQEGYSDNGGTGSAKDYFTDASNGQYSPTFDVYGPYTLPQKMAYYGANDSNDEDVLPAQMVLDACQLANDDINFADYDLDNDGYIDNVFIYYAGYNEAEWGDDDTVWPHRWVVYNGNSTGSRDFDGKILYDYACSSELKGNSGSNMCGIGTFCHEFSHVLGLPDLYDTEYSGHNTLGSWDIMDYGGYSNNGRTPPSFSSYERFYLGWLTPTILNSAANITIDELQSSNQAYLVSSTGAHNLDGASPNPTSFYLLENRQQTGWDTYLPGHGMLVTKISYSASKWSNNTVNNTASSMGVDIIEADGRSSQDGDSGDTYPNGTKYTSYTPYSNYPITDITEDNQVISFKFMGGTIDCNDISVYFSGDNCTQTNGFDCLDMGDTYISTITPNAGYMLSQDDILITMGTTDLEADVDFTYVGTTLTVPSVTGDLEIVAIASVDPDAQVSFIETFDKCIETSSTDIASDIDDYADNKGWSGTKLFCNSGELKLGSSKAKGDITTPALGIAGTVELSFESRNYDDSNSTLTLGIKNGGTLSTTSISMTSIPKTYNVTISNCTANTTVSFVNSQNRFYLDDVKAIPAASTGIEQSTLTGITILTSEEVIQLLGVEANSDVRLYDLTGKCLFTKRTNASQNLQISVAKGYYIIQVENSGKQMNQKVWVQ